MPPRRPKRDSFWLALRTICPALRTICSALRLICSELRLICSELRTICPEARVICSALRLICPALRTICPEARVICSALRLICSEGRTICSARDAIRADPGDRKVKNYPCAGVRLTGFAEGEQDRAGCIELRSRRSGLGEDSQSSKSGERHDFDIESGRARAMCIRAIRMRNDKRFAAGRDNCSQTVGTGRECRALSRRFAGARTI